MWGETLWQKFVFCFTIVFFIIWISTLASWTTIYYARQEGQGAQSAPFSKVVCGELKDENNVKATKTGPKGYLQPPSALYNHSPLSHSNTGTAFSSGITMTADSKWRPTLFGQVQTGTASVKDVELQTACPSWNRWACLAASCVSVW